MTTDRLMPDVLKSITAVSGELCVVTVLTTETRESPAICSDSGEHFFVRLVLDSVRCTVLLSNCRRDAATSAYCCSDKNFTNNILSVHGFLPTIFLADEKCNFAGKNYTNRHAYIVHAEDPVCIYTSTMAAAQDQSGWTTCTVLATRCL